VTSPGRRPSLHDALALWRGEPLADIDSEVLLRALAERHPLRERLWWLLMTALRRCGRRAEALDAYREISRHLADDLGIDPGAELGDLHLAVLNDGPGDVAITGRAATGPASADEPSAADQPSPAWVGQCRLPPVVPDFVGREASIATLLDHLRPIDGAPPTRVVTVSGLLGSGKTALALYVAHALRADYPDGQWYVRLGGAGPDPRAPARVLDWYLRTALAAGEVLGHGTDPPPPAPEGAVPTPAFPAVGDALGWFDAERDTVVALIRIAADEGPAPYAWRLFEAIQPDLRNRNHVDAREAAVTAALGAANGDRGVTAGCAEPGHAVVGARPLR
jgi:hypothetical protein